MEEYRNSALAYYGSLPLEQQALAYNFFRALDTDGDGDVSLIEFLEFLLEAGLVSGQNPIEMFRMFDRDGNGKLDYYEVVTLFQYLTIGPGAQVCRSANTRSIGNRRGKWRQAFAALDAFSEMLSLALDVMQCLLM